MDLNIRGIDGCDQVWRRRADRHGMAVTAGKWRLHTTKKRYTK
jgi:hypothetical protein